MLTVIVPSRGRPGNIRRLREGWAATEANADLWCCVDLDDPTLADYPIPDQPDDRYTKHTAPRQGLAGTLNTYANDAAHHDPYIGFMGDDHLPRTPHWDRRVIAALAELRTGVVYCNDLFQGERLPTAVFVTSDIVRTLGYMCPPGLRHMYLDNVWLEWGRGIDRIRYLPDVIIEHIHPQIGKAEVDAGYEEVWPLMGPDHDAFHAYKASGHLDADLTRLRALL